MTTKYRIRMIAQADLELIWLYTCEQIVRWASRYLSECTYSALWVVGW